MKKFFYMTLISVGVILTISSVLNLIEGSKTTIKPKPVVEEVELTEEIIYSGKVLPKFTGNFFVTNALEVKDVLVNKGELVKEGQLLIKTKYRKNNYYAPYDGIIHYIGEDAKAAKLSANPFLILLSVEKIVMIEVAEYELKYLQRGDVLRVEKSNSDHSIEGVISDISLLPVNIKSLDTSYYETSIDITTEYYYGSSVLVYVRVDGND